MGMLTILQQVTLLIVSVGMILFVRQQVVRGALSFLLGLMWFGIAVIGVSASALIPFIGQIGTVLGLLPAAILAGTASVLLSAVALALSLRISSLEARYRDLITVLGVSTDSPVEVGRPSVDEILTIVPAFNEARSVAAVIESLRSIGLPVLVVNDGSTDATADIARAAGADVIDLPINLGVGGALRAGFQTALMRGHRAVLQCDADGQHPIESVARLIEEHRRDPADLLIGSRFLAAGVRKQEPFIRRSALALLANLASRASRHPITDATSGLRIICSPLLEELARAMPAHYLGDTFEVNVMAGRSGYKIREVAVSMRPRVAGVSTASPFAAFRLTLRGALVVLLRAQRRVAAPKPGRARRGDESPGENT